MYVEDILRKKNAAVVTVPPDLSLAGAIAIMHARQIGALVIVDGLGQIVGLLTERNVMRELGRNGEAGLHEPVSNAMMQHVIFCRPEDTLKETAFWMVQHGVRYLPVVMDGELKGIVSMGDVVRHRLEEAELETNVLRDLYIASH